MLNHYYLYALTWGAVLLCYHLGWSAFNQPLNPGLAVFFGFVIAVCLCIGFLKRKRFAFVRPKAYRRKGPGVTLALVGAYLLEFLYCREIPLFTYIIHKTDVYATGGYTGFPVVHVFLVSFTAFYAVYLFYLFVCFPGRRGLLPELLALWGMMALLCSRGSLVMSAVLCANLGVAAGRGKGVLRGLVRVLAGLLVLALVAYAFGGLGNLREGGGWNDTANIQRMGRYVRYPAGLPKQYMWAYSYLTSPLANLNNNVAFARPDLPRYLASAFVPDFLSKRLFPALVTNRGDYYLTAPYFNASTGYIAALYNGGIPGLYGMFLFQLAFFAFVERLARRARREAYTVSAWSALALMGVLFFFYNTNTLSAVLLQAVYPSLAMVWRVRIVFGGQQPAPRAGGGEGR